MDYSDEETFSSQFSALDELIQLIYQGSSKFVVLSSVNDSGWTVHLGLTGTSGRWWEGTWTEKAFEQFIGHKTSSKLVDTFVDHLSKAFVDGHLYIANWSPDEGASIDLTVGTTAKTPVHIPLKEMKAKDAAAYAAQVFAEIATQAQERQCKLNPPAYQVRSIVPSHRPSTPPSKPVSTKRKVDERESDSRSPPKSAVSKPKSRATEKEAAPDTGAQAKIKELERELAKAQQEVKQAKQKASSEDMKSDNKLLASRAKNNNVPAGRPAKGASLANPNKKARKYQAIEFDDD